MKRRNACLSKNEHEGQAKTHKEGHMNKIIVKTPKVPSLNIKKIIRSEMESLTHGLKMELSYYKKTGIKETKTQEKKPIGAGRGGKVCGKVSNMGRMAESATHAKRGKYTPYKPNPEMHTLWAISDMRTGHI